MRGMRGRINGEVGGRLHIVIEMKGIAVADGAYYSDMVEAEERKMKERETALKEQEKQEEANHKSKHKDNEHHGKKKPHKEEKDSGGDKKGK